MASVLVHVWSKAGSEEAFIAATMKNAQASGKEEGNIRFDYFQSAENPSKFTLVEVYETAEQAAKHQTAPHFLAWKDDVKDILDKFEVEQMRSLHVPRA